MLLMIAGTTVMFASCDSGSSNSEQVIATDTVNVETTYEVERTTVETDTSTSTETIEAERDTLNRQ